MAVTWTAKGRSCPALSDGRGQYEGPVRHSQIVVESHVIPTVQAALGAGREAETSSDRHSQMVVEKRPDPDHSQVFAEHSQEVADRTMDSVAAHSNSHQFSTDKR